MDDPQQTINAALTPEPVTPPAVPPAAPTPEPVTPPAPEAIPPELVAPAFPPSPDEVPLAFTTAPVAAAPTMAAAPPAATVPPFPVVEEKKRGKSGKVLLAILGIFMLLVGVGGGGYYYWQTTLPKKPAQVAVVGGGCGYCANNRCVQCSAGQTSMGDCTHDSQCQSGGCTGPAQCQNGEVCRGGECVAGNSGNAGSCVTDNGCQSGQICTNGQCVTGTRSITCQASNLTQCGGSTGCVDLSSNPLNCGSCGMACGGTKVCNHGSCVSTDTGACSSGGCPTTCNSNQIASWYATTEPVGTSYCNSQGQLCHKYRNEYMLNQVANSTGNQWCFVSEGEQCGAAGSCGGNTTVTSSPSPTPTLACSGLTQDKPAPVMNDVVTFTCAGATTPTNAATISYNFRYNINAGTWTAMTNKTATTAQLTIAACGTYSVECQACATLGTTKTCDPNWQGATTQ